MLTVKELEVQFPNGDTSLLKYATGAMDDESSQVHWDCVKSFGDWSNSPRHGRFQASLDEVREYGCPICNQKAFAIKRDPLVEQAEEHLKRMQESRAVSKRKLRKRYG